MVTLPRTFQDLMEEGQLSAEIVFNDLSVVMDSLIGLPKVLLWLTSTVPTSPQNGDVWLVGTGSGAWDGQDGNLAIYWNGWFFVPPFDMLVFDVDGSRIAQFNTVSGLWTTFGTAGSPGDTLNWFDASEAPYSAVGDGSDDTTPIQTALDDAATAGGGTVYLPGTGVNYSVTGLDIPGNVTLVGDGPGATTLKLLSSSDTNIITIPFSPGRTDVRLANITLDCNTAGNPSLAGGIAANNVTRLRINNVEVENVGTISQGIAVVDCTDVVVSDCSVHDTAATSSQGIYVTDSFDTHIINCVCTTVLNAIPFGVRGSDRVTITNCQAISCDSATADFLIYGSTNVSVTDCISDGTLSQYGFSCVNDTTTMSEKVTFNGCTVLNSISYGFHGTDSRDIVFHDCRAEGCSTGARISTGDLSRLTERIILSSCHIIENESIGINLRGVRNSTIIGCTIMNNASGGTASGIVLDDGVVTAECENILITGNRIGDDQGSPTQEYAVDIRNASVDVTISSNDMTGNVQSSNPILIGASVTGTRISLNRGVPDEVTVASASNLVLRDIASGYIVSGTTQIDTITSVRAGRIVTLRFTSTSCVVSSTSGLKLIGGDFQPSSTDDILVLYDDGSTYREVSRSNSIATSVTINFGVGDFVPDDVPTAGTSAASLVRVGTPLFFVHGWDMPDGDESFICATSTPDGIPTGTVYTKLNIRFTSLTSGDNNLLWSWAVKVSSVAVAGTLGSADSSGGGTAAHGSNALRLSEHTVNLTPVSYTTGDTIIVSIERDGDNGAETASQVIILGATLTT